MTKGIITVDPDSPQAYTLELAAGEILLIGRKPDLAGKRKLLLPYPEVSGQHAEIRCGVTGWTIIDCGSTNGTTLNGTRLVPGREYSLHRGDRIHVAQYPLLVVPPRLDAAVPEKEDNQGETQFRINIINATILVGDIKGFTALMEEYADDPTPVMQAAQQVFEIINLEIHKNHGQLEKIAGDAIMAYWTNKERANTEQAGVHACHACAAALKLQALVKTLAADRKYWPFANHPLKLDMALATGPVAAGALGHANVNPALLGDTANLVFRLEKLIDDDAAGDIIAEYETYALARSSFNFKALGQFNIKGRQKAVDVYRLVGAG